MQYVPKDDSINFILNNEDYKLDLVLLFEQVLDDNDKIPKQVMENVQKLMELPNPFFKSK